MIQQVLMGRQRTCKKLWNRRIWWCWIWQLQPAGMWHPLVWWKCTDVSSSHHRRPWCLLHRLTMEAGGSLWNLNTLLPDYTFHFKRQRYEYFKILTGVQNTSEDAKMSVGIRLIPDLTMLGCQWQPLSCACPAVTTRLARELLRKQREGGIMEQSNKCVIYEWRVRPPVITSPSREPRGRPALCHRDPAHACGAWM